MRIVCVMAIHDRKHRESIIRDSVQRLLYVNQVTPVLVTTDRHDRDLARKLNCHFVNSKNNPLSNKWQMGIEGARELNPDAVLIMGSDDWISQDWVPTAWRALEQGLDLTGKAEWYVAVKGLVNDLKIKRQWFVDARKNRCIGAGRLISRRILDSIKWKLFPPGLDRGLDYGSFQQIVNGGGVFRPMRGPHSPKVLLVKGPWEAVNHAAKLDADDGIVDEVLGNHGSMKFIDEWFPSTWGVLEDHVCER